MFTANVGHRLPTSTMRYNYRHDAYCQNPICIITTGFRSVLFALPCQPPASYVFAVGATLPGLKQPIGYSSNDSLADFMIVLMPSSKVCFITIITADDDDDDGGRLEILSLSQLCIMRLMSHNYSYHCLEYSAAGPTTCKR